MAKLGTAFVEVQPDFSAFDRLVSRKLAGSFKDSGEQSGRDFSRAFDKQTSGLLVPLSREAQRVGDALNVKLPTRIPAPKVDVPQVNVPDLSSTGRIVLQTQGAEANVERLRAHVAELVSKPQTLEVKVQVAKAIADLDRAEAKVRDLNNQRADIKVDVDQSLFSRLTERVQGLTASLGGSGGGGLGGSVTRVSAGFLSFGSSLGPVVALAAALAVTVGVSLVGALAALAASLAAAAAGAAALGVAFAAVLGPAAALAIAVGSRIAKVTEALKAQDAATQQAGAGSQAAAAAAQQQAAASRALTEANRQLGLATSSAYREMADAAEKASDAIRGIESAQVSLEQSKLNVDKAKLALQQFREEAGATGQAFGAVFAKFTDVAVDTSGLRKAITDANTAAGGGLDQSQELELRQKILDVRQARLDEKAATDGVSDAQRAATRAQQDNNKFKRQGILASESYRAALRGVESATLAVTAAQRQDTFSSVQSKAIELTGKLSEGEQRFLTVLKRVRVELRGALSPATDAVFGGMTRALGRVPALINPLRGAFRRLGEAVGHSLDRFSTDIVKPKAVASFRRFTDTAAKLAGPITDGLLALFHIFLDIANAALPHLVSGTRKVADQLKDWSVGTSNTKKLNATIKTLVGHLKTWLGVGAAIGDVFLAFLESAAGPGQSLAESIKSLAERTATWLRSTEGREQLKQFFKDAIAFTKDFVTFMGRLIVFTVRFGQEGARVFSKVSDLLGGSKNVADALVFTLGTLAALKFTRGLISGIQSVASGLRAASRAATLLHARMFAVGGAEAGAGLVGKAKVALVSVGSALASTGRAIVSAGRAIAARLIAVFATQGALAGAAAGNAAAGAEGLGRPGIKARAAAAGRSVGRAFGLAVVAGVVAGLVGLADQVNKSVTGAFGDKFKQGARNFADDRNNNPLSKALNDTVNKLKGLLGLNRGGIVPGVGNRDTRPALLTPGEHVTRKLIVNRFGPTTFADINAGRLDPRIGYQPGQQPTLSVVPARGPRLAAGGLITATTAATAAPTVLASFPITVPGGGSPDPVALGVQASRVIEDRFGGDVRQD